ncbi:hypothetical protein, partial [uncultured Acetatifactor sp.]|uniref:hypothetical protein n=1 Tax=uncultured Acetatifactor sp. TaxID=1671927 RepID=UPI00272DBFBA
AYTTHLSLHQFRYQVGDTVTFSQAGNSITYTVSAIVFDRNRSASFILPAGEMEQMVPYNAICRFSIPEESRHDGHHRPYREDIRDR